EDVLDGHRAEMAEAEDLPGQLALPAGEDDAVPLDLPVVRLPVATLAEPGRRDGLGGEGGVREQLEPEGRQAGPGGGGAGRMSGEDLLLAFLEHQTEALVDLVDDGDRRRERGLAGRGRLPMAPEIEVE